jgi:hypothetical protein
LREHTRYLRLAKEWEEVGKPSDRRLLSAADIALANAWIADQPQKATPPTDLQLEFIGASEGEDTRRKSAEAQRLEDIVDARTREAEAQKETAARASQVARRTLAGLAAAVTLALVAGVIAIYAMNERDQAQVQGALAKAAKRTAEQQRRAADEQRDRALLQESRALAILGRGASDRGD